MTESPIELIHSGSTKQELPGVLNPLYNRVVELLKDSNATVVSHYYTQPDMQMLAEQTGGFVGDSLAMAEFGMQASADILVIAGVKFMGETAKILSPEKRILMPTLEATCSLDLGCPADEFSAFCDQHPDRTVVVYANTSAAVKARADWVVTSSNALEIVDYLDARGDKIIWAPDKYLGSYIKNNTKADMLLWDSSCIVHEEFQLDGLKQLKALYPEAAVLVHPESPASVVGLADVVGSTSRLLSAAESLPNPMMIVATDRGIFYKMRQRAPHKAFIEAPTNGQSATCRACAQCPWMQMNTLESLEKTLLSQDNEVKVDALLREKALIPLQRMVEFSH